MTDFNFGERVQIPGGFTQESFEVKRSQLEYPLDEESKGTLRRALEDIEKDVIRRRNRISLNLDTTQTSFNVASDYMVLSGDSTLAIATIGGGREGQILTLQFSDSDIAITNDSSEALNTINTTAAFISSPNATFQMLFDGISWRELNRAINDTV